MPTIVQEIERRFLLKFLPTIIKPSYTLDIKQYYLDVEGERRRLRFSRKRYDTTPHDLEYIHKNTKKQIELHYDITHSEAEVLKEQAHKVTSKVRRVFITDNHKFEIDCISGIDFILMEVELEQNDQEIIFPNFIKECIACEVTGIKELSNYSLATPI